MATFPELVSVENLRLRAKGYRISSWHEAYGLILEEVDEFFDEVKKRSAKRDRVNALRELTQIAALCQRAAEDLLAQELSINDQVP